MIKRKEEMLYRERNMRGGVGLCKTVDLMLQEEMRHCRLFGTITIDKGNSIGAHDHVNETEYYYILSGEGGVTESDGEKVVKAGDLVITGGGASHAIRNEQNEPLVFLALIILDGTHSPPGTTPPLHFWRGTLHLTVTHSTCGRRSFAQRAPVSRSASRAGSAA